jgi:hypothetical protein
MKICHATHKADGYLDTRVLRSSSDLGNEIILFLEMKERDVSNIKITKWILDFTFMVDITTQTNYT